jgi:hypothetical protein
MLTREQIAQFAARLVARGDAPDVATGVQLALARLKAPPSLAPGHGEVRRHLQAISQQTLGAAGYAAMVRERLELAESVMTVLTELDEVVDVVLAGRAAAGHLDGDLTLHVRAYTRRLIGDLAEALVSVGYEEPTFVTAETRFGRLDRLQFKENGVQVAVTRCMPALLNEASRDLYEDKPARTLTLEALRRRISELPDSG